MLEDFGNFVKHSLPRYSSEEDEGEIIESDQAEQAEDNSVNASHNGPTSNRDNKFSIWSNILIEEELTESINSNLSVKKDGKHLFNDRDVESYDFMLAYKGKKRKKRVKNGENQTNNHHPKFKKAKFKNKTSFNRFKARKQSEMIASKLKEKRKDLIVKAIKFLGFDQVMSLLNQVLSIEEAGGMMTNDNKRRRTPGGVFFHLLKKCGKLTEAQLEQLFKEKQFIKEKKKFKTKNIS